MTILERAEADLDHLIPLESFRSPLVPTSLTETVVLLGMVAPVLESPPGSVEPSFWFAVDPEADEVVAFAQTSVHSLIDSHADLGPMPEVSRDMRPRAAYALLRDSRSAILEAFSAGRPLDPELAAQVRTAYAVTMPPSLTGWLRLACADFFGWLGDPWA